MQNVVDDVSLRLTAAGLTPTDTVVLLRLDSGALERITIISMLTLSLTGWTPFMSPKQQCQSSEK